jgi:glutaconate CoA-transferase, subunit B
LSELAYTPAEMMTIEAARRLKNHMVCFVGIGLPSAAANLARALHAPDVVLIYEAGAIGSKPDVLPLSIGDGELAETAETVVSVPEIFRYWLQGGRVDVGFLGAAQIDRLGRINTTVIGEYRNPSVRLPGAGGAPEIATSAKEVLIVMKQSRRNFVGKLDFVTSSGFVDRPIANFRARGRGRTTVITDLGIMVSDPSTHELTLSALHPGVSAEQAIAETGWKLSVSPQLGRTAVPGEHELATLRDLYARTARAHGSTITTPSE